MLTDVVVVATLLNDAESFGRCSPCTADEETFSGACCIDGPLVLTLDDVVLTVDMPADSFWNPAFGCTVLVVTFNGVACTVGVFTGTIFADSCGPAFRCTVLVVTLSGVALG